jgi:hypothetical protein
VARRIAFHNPINADFHKHALVQSFMRGVARGPGGVDTEVKGFSETGTESELHHTGITCDKNDNRINYTEIT